MHVRSVSMAPGAGELAEAAQAAMAAGDWKAAHDRWAALVEQRPTPEALAALGDTLWWLGRTAEAVGHLERAYAAFQRRGDPAGSVPIAVALYLNYRVSLGNVSAARGWLARADRLASDPALGPASGWVALIRAHDCVDPVAAEGWSRDARDAGQRFGDPDLELCAISQLGAALVQQGRSTEGTTLLDEAMAAALAGECRRPHTVVYTSCTLIGACAEVTDVDRVLQWVRAAGVFTDRFHSEHLHLHCRIYYGAVLIEAGRWADADRELQAAVRAGSTAEPALYAEACARLAELRLDQGRLEEAERLLQGLHDFTTSACVLAAVAARRGDTATAGRIAARRLRELADPADARDGAYRVGLALSMEAALLWELIAGVSSGPDVEHAVAGLTGLAEQTGCAALQARADRASGIQAGDTARLERALSAFTRLRLPLQAARTRMALARLSVGDDAVAEARSALVAFEELGAARDADEAAALLRDLGVTAVRGGPTGLGELTQREREVLDLLGEGLSNRELAERLFLSRKTIEHHVRTVLFKLGLRNRAEAAAYVVRHRQNHSSD